MTDSDKLQVSWKEYIEELYDKNNILKEKNIHLETNAEDVKGPMASPSDAVC